MTYEEKYTVASTSTKPHSDGQWPRSEQKKRAAVQDVLSEELFHNMISLERKRSERTQRPFVLLLMETGHGVGSHKNGRVLLEILSALQIATRETDVMGWY